MIPGRKWSVAEIGLLLAYALFLFVVLGGRLLLVLLDDPPKLQAVLQGKFEGEWVLESNGAPDDVPSRLRFVIDEWFQEHPPENGHLLLEDWARGTAWIDGEPSRFLLETWATSSFLILDGRRRIQIDLQGRWPRELKVDWTDDDELICFRYRRPQG